MTNNNLKTGTKKLKIKGKFGRKNIIKSIKNIFFKCIRIGRKGMWIKPVQSGVSTDDGQGFGTLTWIKNIVSGRRLG
jgi:hypothetical protein